MSDAFDLATILDTWPFEPGELDVRHVTLPDGRAVLQVRIELGLMQLEIQGRPDGQRPEGWPSHLERLLKMPGTMPEGMVLPDADVRALQAEAVQVVRRCALLHMLGLHALLLRDSRENLSRMDLCERLAPDHPATALLQHMRPEVITLHARAAAEAAVAAGDTTAARAALQQGLQDLRDCLPDQDVQQEPHVQLLNALHGVLTPKLPASQRVELQTRLQTAIEHENFELAAILRDELRQLPD